MPNKPLPHEPTLEDALDRAIEAIESGMLGAWMHVQSSSGKLYEVCITEACADDVPLAQVADELAAFKFEGKPN